MTVSDLIARGRLAGVFCGVALTLAASTALADEWAAEVRFSSEEDAPADDSACACQNCTRCYPACCACGDGYCFDSPLSRELACRMAAMANSMQPSGCIYNADAVQFYQGVTSGGAEQEFEYGGKVDQFLILDSGKLGLVAGHDDDAARRDAIRPGRQRRSGRLCAGQRRHAVSEAQRARNGDHRTVLRPGAQRRRAS